MNKAKELFEDLISRATPVSLGHVNILFKERKKEDIPNSLAEYIKHEKRVINTNLGFYIYDSGYYKKIDNEESLKKIAAELLNCSGVTPKPYFLNETVKMLSSLCLIDDKDFNPSNMHNVANGLLKIDLNTGDVVFEKHSPNYYFSYKAEAEYIPDLATQVIEDFMEKIIPDKNQRIISLEALSFAIFPDLRKKVEFTKVTLEYGEGSNGKTINTGLRRRVIGNEVCSSTPIDLLLDKGQRFIASTLYKKRANFSTESESSFIRESSLLKQITSGKPGDELMVEFKHKHPFSAIINPVLNFAINKPPVMPPNRTAALERRIQIINYPNKFSKNPKDGELLADSRLEDPEFTKPHVNGLLILAIKAIKEMIQRSYIWQEGVAETLKKAILKGSHKDLFLEDCIEFDLESEISTSDLHKAYVDFCLEEGIAEEHQTKRGTSISWADERYDKACRKPAGLSKWLNQRLKKKVQDAILYNSDNRRVRGFKGIKLKNKNVDNDLCNRAEPNNDESSQNNDIHGCTDESAHSFENKIKPEFIEKLKDKNATKHLQN